MAFMFLPLLRPDFVYFAWLGRNFSTTQKRKKKEKKEEEEKKNSLSHENRTPYQQNKTNNQQTRELISSRKTSHKHNNKDPSHLAVTLTRHASNLKYKVHKLHLRYKAGRVKYLNKSYSGSDSSCLPPDCHGFVCSHFDPVVRKLNQHTTELISARKTSHKHNKDLSRLR